MRRIDYLPGARQDFDESFKWYAERSTEAARRFADAIDAALWKISGAPSEFASIDGVHQQCTVRIFPFRVVFRDLGNEILIVAVMHSSRRPGYWKHR